MSEFDKFLYHELDKSQGENLGTNNSGYPEDNDQSGSPSRSYSSDRRKNDPTGENISVDYLFS